MITIVELDMPEHVMQRDNKNGYVRVVWRSTVYVKWLYIQKKTRILLC